MQPSAFQQRPDPAQRRGKLFRIGQVAAIEAVTRTQAVVPIQNITQFGQAQVMPSLLVVSALRQTVTGQYTYRRCVSCRVLQGAIIADIFAVTG